MNISRRKFLQAVIFAAPSSAAYARFVEPAWLQVERVDVRVPRSRLSKPLRILHLSDLHVSDVVPAGLVARAVDMGLAEQPDLACITGDFITDKFVDQAAHMAALRTLSGRVETFASLGNHDGGRWAASRGGFAALDPISEFVKESGLRLLLNESHRVDWGDAKVSFVGLADYWSGHFDATRAFAKETDDAFRVVLSHNPDSKQDLKRHAWDVMLCGHTHGGQVIVPMVGAPFAPVNDTRFISGLHEWEGRQLYITRGVGNLHGIRFACRPEISILNLIPS